MALVNIALYSYKADPKDGRDDAEDEVVEEGRDEEVAKEHRDNGKRRILSSLLLERWTLKCFLEFGRRYFEILEEIFFLENSRRKILERKSRKF